MDIPRDAATPQQVVALTEQLLQSRPYGVAALGLGRYEVGSPAGKFHEAFALAHAAGLPCILHAGETEGAPSLWEVLEQGYSLRIGHGVRCLEDERLAAYLREHQIPLEVCPTSNVCLKVARSFAERPLPLLAKGLYVTLNSDDPALFGTSLTDEYLNSHHQLGLSLPTLKQLSHNALDASLLSEAEKQALRGKWAAREGVTAATPAAWAERPRTACFAKWRAMPRRLAPGQTASPPARPSGWTKRSRRRQW